MQRKPVSSSQIASVGYDPARKLLEVEFLGSKGKPNTLYEYDNVPQDVYDGFFVTKEEDGSERSVGRYFTNAVKRWPLKYPYRKLELEVAPGELTGKVLYERYATLTLARQNCSMESWHSLELEDQATWDALARTLRNA